MGRLFGAVAHNWSLFFWALLVLLVSCFGTESRQTIIWSFEHNHHSAPSMSISNDADVIKTLQKSWVFDIKDMRAGERKAIYFPKKEESGSGRFLPREKADSLPFSRKDLSKILDLYGFSRGSQQAAFVESALEACEKPPGGEVFKACFTSFESMLESMFRIFNISDLSHHDHPTLLATVFRGAHNTAFQNYTVLEEPVEVATPKMVGCHSMAYPYAVFYCHILTGEARVFNIPLVGDDGVGVDAVAACHLDTSMWDRENWAFLTLGSKPGDPVCHFFPPYDNFAWVHTPLPTSASANKASI